MFLVKFFQWHPKRQVAPGDREEEEGGPVDKVPQPREANQLMEVEGEVREV